MIEQLDDDDILYDILLRYIPHDILLYSFLLYMYLMRYFHLVYLI